MCYRYILLSLSLWYGYIIYIFRQIDTRRHEIKNNSGWQTIKTLWVKEENNGALKLYIIINTLTIKIGNS